MKAPALFIAAALLLSSLPACAADKTQTRCGWVLNPSPGNMSLRDKDAEWTITQQGNYQAKGADKITDMSGDQYVDIGPHGYGCGCVTGTVDEESAEIMSIESFEQKKLKECLGDEELPLPER